MGLFDRFKTSQARRRGDRSAGGRRPNRTSADARRSRPRRRRGDFEDSVREHLERAHRRRGLRHRLARRRGVRRRAHLAARRGRADPGHRARVLVRLPVRRPHPRGAHPRPAHCRRHAARLPHRRDRAAASPSLVNQGRTNLLELLEATAGRRASASARGGRSVYAVHRATPRTPRASRASSTTPRTAGCPDVDDQQRLVFAAYRHADHPPAVLDAGRDPRRPTGAARCTCYPSRGTLRQPTMLDAGR